MEGILKTFKTTILKCDEPTITGRIYPKDLIKKSLKEDKVLQEKLVNNCLFGELGNWLSDEVDLSKVAFSVRKLYWYRNELKVVVDILDTPNGRLLIDYIDTMKISCIGTGDVDP